MPTWRLDLEYDGGRYSGWQQQPHARTIQGELLKACGGIFKEKVDIGGAGRTDAGVHARGQVAHLRTQTAMPEQALMLGLNDRLPADINILSVKKAKPSFDARHDAISRIYTYQIATRRTAFGKPYVWWIKDRLNVAIMKEACQQLIGMHDFRSFSDASDASTLVKVTHCELVPIDNMLIFRIAASHFLWKMVRRVVGVLVEIGRGHLQQHHLQTLLKELSSAPAAWTAPPSGLFLEKVIYTGDTFPTIVRPAFAID